MRIVNQTLYWPAAKGGIVKVVSPNDVALNVFPLITSVSTLSVNAPLRCISTLAGKEADYIFSPLNAGAPYSHLRSTTSSERYFCVNSAGLYSFEARPTLLIAR